MGIEHILGALIAIIFGLVVMVIALWTERESLSERLSNLQGFNRRLSEDVADALEEDSKYRGVAAKQRPYDWDDDTRPTIHPGSGLRLDSDGVYRRWPTPPS